MTLQESVKKSIGIRRYRRLPKHSKDFLRRIDALPRLNPPPTPPQADRA